MMSMIMDAQSQLSLKNKAYLKALNLYVWEAYKMDLGKGDITSETFLKRKNNGMEAEIICKENGILAGIQEAKWFLNKLKLKILKSKKDGEKIKKGDVILKIKGEVKTILKVERTLLNLLQRMSGVATKTNTLRKKLPQSIQLLATRKTLWGHLDKRAVSIGGGGTHRLNLSDAILVKENHVSMSPNYEKSLLRTFEKVKTVRFIEFEVESIEEAKKILEIYKKYQRQFFLKQKTIIMLDDFKLNNIKKILPPLKKGGLIVEVSGGVNEKTISRYNIKGIDAISSGAITMAAKHLDLSLRINV